MRRLSQNLRAIQRELETAFMRRGRKSLPKYKVPAGSPCESCLMKIGSIGCRTDCDYFKTLQKLRAEGKLERVKEDD